MIYYEEAIIHGYEALDMFIGQHREFVEVALECIEKQIPKKPINATGYYRDNKCPSCGKPIKSGKGSSSHYRNDWCNKCGQRIDWSEVEKSE